MLVVKGLIGDFGPKKGETSILRMLNYVLWKPIILDKIGGVE